LSLSNFPITSNSDMARSAPLSIYNVLNIRNDNKVIYSTYFSNFESWWDATLQILLSNFKSRWNRALSVHQTEATCRKTAFQNPLSYITWKMDSITNYLYLICNVWRKIFEVAILCVWGRDSSHSSSLSCGA